MKNALPIFAGLLLGLATTVIAADPWVVYEGKAGPGHGKHVVLISGDEEYRSEEALPQLGKILSVRHGFKCTVLFAIDDSTGLINPNNGRNIPGLAALKTADLMVIATRFRDLPDDQMQHIDDYLKAGKPVIGLRTATHAFNISGNKPWAHYGNGYKGAKKEWADGFGRLVLGEQWINHHGAHGREAARGILTAEGKEHPVLRGIKDGDVFALSDVYGVRLPLPGDSQPLVLGQVVAGMKFDDPAVAGKKNEPMMPVAWTKSYQLPDGKKGRSFATTMGAAVDMKWEGSRRLLVNAAYWAIGLDVPAKSAVDTVGKFEPSMFGFKPGDYWPKQNLKPADFRLE